MRKDYHLQVVSFVTLIVLLGTSITAHGQSYLINEGFEGEGFPPKEWKIVDNDGDGHCWQTATRSDATVSGEKTAISYTVNPNSPTEEYGIQDNYLITPQIEVTNETFQISFKYCAQDLDSKEKIEVRISESGTDVKDFTTILYEETVDNGYDDYPTLKTLTRSLSEYNGKKIYIAFVHKGSGSYALGIDDVEVTNQKGPKAISNLTVTPGENGALSATLTWKNPQTDGTGTDITGELAIGIYRDNKLLTAITENVTPGGTSSYTDTSMDNGMHTYSVIAKTGEGQSKAVSKRAYIGEDVPAEVENLNAYVSEGQTIITWNAPTKGMNKGYINTENLTYTVERKTDNGTEVIAEGIKERQYTDKVSAGALHSYIVTASNNTGTSKPITSNAVISYGDDMKDISAGMNANTEYGNPYLPFDFSQRYGVYQAVFYPEDLMYAKGTIRHIVYKNSFSSSKLEKPIRIWLGETDKQDLSEGWISTENMKEVYNGNIAFVNGINDVPVELAEPYEYTGKNLVVVMTMDYSQGNGGYFDRFFIEQTPDKPKRTRSYMSYEPIDNSMLTESTGGLYDAMLMTRFVMNTKDAAGLHGTVTDKDTDKPIGGAIISIPELKLSTVTDNNGEYSFYVVPSGLQHVTITATGYLDFEKDITIQNEGEQTENFSIEAKPTITVRGCIKSEDTGKPLKNVRINAYGYSDVSTTSADDGTFELGGIYANESYSLSIETPLYDVYRQELPSDKDLNMEEIILTRSLISVYGVSGEISSDGSYSTISWKDPLSRKGRIMWTKWGNSEYNESTGGDYSATDYNVAHAFTADDIKDSMMIGQSFLKMKVFIKAEQGTYTAKIWKGTRDNNVEIASKEIPASEITAEGAWVTVEFDSPGVEIKEGENYLIGVNCKNGPTDPIGTAGYGSSIDGKNNLKWSNDQYLYDGYYAWNISAYCGIPGTELPVTTETEAPKCSYNIYRIDTSQTEQKTKLNKDPLTELTFTDNDWDELTAGKYMYCVKAVYNTDKESASAYTDTIVRAINIDAGIAEFISPIKTIDPQGKVEVKVRVKNYGEKPLTNVSAYFTVNDNEPIGETFTVNLNKGETTDLTLGSYELKEKALYIFKAYTEIEGDEAVNNDAKTFSLPNFDDVGLRAYRWDAYGNAGMMKIHSNIPEQASFIKEVIPDEALINAGEYYDGRVYAYTATWYSEPRQFVVLDTITWAPVASAITEDFIQDMAFDYSSKTMFGLRATNTTSELVKISLTNGETELIGNTGINLHAMACSKDGILYAISSDGDLCTIDKATGIPTTIGNTGITDVAYLQSMAFDHNTGRLFWVHTGAKSQGELYEVNPETAKLTPLGTAIYNDNASELVCLYTVYDHTASGINAMNGNDGKFIVYPDGKNLTISLPLENAETAEVKIVNTAGIMVASTIVNGQITSYKVNLMPGVYVAIAKTSAGRIYKAKPFVIR